MNMSIDVFASKLNSTQLTIPPTSIDPSVKNRKIFSNTFPTRFTIRHHTLHYLYQPYSSNKIHQQEFLRKSR